MGLDHLKELQETDGTLAGARVKAMEGAEGYFKRDGVIYRQWQRPGEGLAVDQIVLPQDYREKVLELAHTIPLAGHLGKKKTADRVVQRFYWPTVHQDVAKFCRSCAACQKSSHGRIRRAPMIPLPVVGEPFQRIAMDIVGPLPRNRAGNRYVLVICDYATRYPEAVPLCSIDAEHVAEELVKLFSRVGIPREILKLYLPASS